MNWESTLTWEDAKKRASIISKIRMFFYQKNIVEVETPLLCKSSVTDIHLEAFKTQYHYFPETNSQHSDDMFLQTSPEYCMKRLLASGYQSIYQITKAFRHECKGRFHNPEFTMIEWYRIGFLQTDLMDEVSTLLKFILHCDEPQILSYQELFIEKINIDPLETNCHELKEVITLACKMEDWIRNETCVDILLQFIMSELIEPIIGQIKPIFIYNFPISQGSLARQSKIDKRVAERFECYYKGVELVNGFCELTDAKEQLSRFNQDNVKREKLKLKHKAIDSRFIEALEAGIPSCAGVALGLDRLLMLALDKKAIDEVLTFSVDRA